MLPIDSSLSTANVPLIDMHSIQLYTASFAHLLNVTAPLAAERAIEITSSLIDLARIENGAHDQPRPTIWNVWDPIHAEGSNGAEETYTLSDALAIGVWLNVFVRKSSDLGVACIAQSVNVISPLITTKEGIVKQTIWWPLYLFSKYMRGWTVNAHVSTSVYEGETSLKWIRGVKDTPWLDVSATMGEDGYVNVVVINIHEEQAKEVEITGTTGEVTVFTITGEHPMVTNMRGREEVGVVESIWTARGLYVFPKHSLTLLRWRV